MWMHILSLALALASVVLCLDSNEIRSSREIITDSQQTAMPAVRETVDVNVHNVVRRRQQANCTQKHEKGCRGSRKRQRHGKASSTALPEVVRRHECLKSRDCEEGWCCVHYPSGRRCQRLLQKGDVCLLGGKPKSKSRIHLERCGCGAGLQCRWQVGNRQGQGVCHV
ncbi:dickkopf-related protein 4-like [Trichomycterus rosablanca]|uniref:dickkopf-related protein 4-like n=1 Tax=Trichomycterus rosablanca TaxID=2290929 RepID=UPI002F35F1C1